MLQKGVNAKIETLEGKYCDIFERVYVEKRLSLNKKEIRRETLDARIEDVQAELDEFRDLDDWNQIRKAERKLDSLTANGM
eukprot:TRINITY_DN2188_c0_g1_i1.p1 TRINITY_DN2188_c0_g1~~TRINITY_DN2188_c0_g1_i1.p1  ORF type:complete len:81 (-),score=17.73 TRINITY_DN2188_c0_g1_i1:414-656(-)